MRIKPLVIGLCILLISIPGYQLTPTLVSQFVHMFLGSMAISSGGGASSMLHQMGYPSRSAVVSILEFSFAGLALVGACFTVFGSVAKKIKKQVTVKLVTEQPDQVNMAQIDSPPKYIKPKVNHHTLAILQDRLASGEITADEFQRLRTLLEQSYQANS